MGGPSPKSFGDLRKLFLRLFELVCDDKKNEKPEVVRFAFLRLRIVLRCVSTNSQVPGPGQNPSWGFPTQPDFLLSSYIVSSHCVGASVPHAYSENSRPQSGM